MMSLPSPPLIVSSPFPPHSRSLPPRPLIVFLPPRPKIRSVPEVPVSVSFLSVPTFTVMTIGTVSFPSLRLKVSIAVPLLLSLAVTLIVRLFPLRPIWILALGTRDVLLFEASVKVSESPSGSLSVRLIVPLAMLLAEHWPLVTVAVGGEFGGLTVCGSPAEVLVLKLLSPAYAAVSVRLPTVVSVMLHWPAATVLVQLSTPSLTVTFPVGVPAPGAFTVTLYCTVTALPCVEGPGLSEVIVVVVSALLTVCASAAEVLPLKVLSPS